MGKILYENAEWTNQCSLNVGYLPQNFDFFENLTLMESLQYLMLARGINPEKHEAELKMWLEYMNLTKHTTKKVKKLSGGMRQRMGIVQAFIGNPQVVLLDEPTVGLDPKERLAFRNMVNEVCDNRIIVVSTHILDDVESTCEKMISLKQGVVTYEGNIKDYVDDAKGRIYTAKLTREEFFKIGDEISVIAIKREGDMILIRFTIKNEAIMKTKFIDKSNPINESETSLEDAYFINMYLDS